MTNTDFEPGALEPDGAIAPAAPKVPNQAQLERLLELAEKENIAKELDDEMLQKIGREAVEGFEIDTKSRQDWEDEAREGMKAALQEAEEKSYPFEDASNVKFPLLTSAVNQFAARAYGAMVDPVSPVRAKVVGADPDGKKSATAQRVAAHMSQQLLYDMDEWEEDMDTLLHQVPIIGCGFKKVFHAPELGRNRAESISAFDLVVNHNTRSLADAPRITHRFARHPHEIEERKRAGVYLNVDLGVAEPSEVEDQNDENQVRQDDDTAPHDLLEQHTILDLDDDGYPEPYIVTVHKASAKVLRIQANYTEDDIQTNGETGEVVRIQRRDFFVKYPFLPNPDGGFYDVGLAKLLGGIAGVIDTSLNQMLDAAHLQNAGGGLITRGLRFKEGTTVRFRPNEYKVVNAPDGKARDAIFQFQFPGPSSTLFQLLGTMIEAGREVASIKDVLTGDAPSGQPATATLALIEQGLKVFTGIFKRMHRAFRKELKLLFRLNSEHLSQEEYVTILDQQAAVVQQDYNPAAIDIEPVSDIRAVTDLQKAARAQVLMEMKQDPAIDGRVAMRRFLEAMQFDGIDELMPEPQPNPIDAMQLEAASVDLALNKAKLIETIANAIQKVADAESKEAGPQLEIYKQFIDELGQNAQPFDGNSPGGDGGVDGTTDDAVGVQGAEQLPAELAGPVGGSELGNGAGGPVVTDDASGQGQLA